jgi:hypothetical protein
MKIGILVVALAAAAAINANAFDGNAVSAKIAPLGSVEEIAEFCDSISGLEPDQWLREIQTASTTDGHFDQSKRIQLTKMCGIYAVAESKFAKQHIDHLKEDLDRSSEHGRTLIELHETTARLRSCENDKVK